MAFKPSRYQILLVTLVIITIVILLNPNLIFPDRDKGSIRIGIVDSGCSVDQTPNVADSVTFTKEQYGYSYDENSVYDTIGHGTKVCSIIIDGTDDVVIYSAKVANTNGELTYAGLFAAVTYLVNEQNVDIINLSLGGQPYFSDQLFGAFENYAAEVVFVAAVGNQGNKVTYPDGIVDWPATLPWIIGVGATISSERADYSSFGRGSTGIFSTEYTEDGFIDGTSGTSFSAPRVTASVANLWQELLKADIEVTPELINYYLGKSTSEQFSSEIGWGKPKSSNFNLSQDGILIQGFNEWDRFTRFEGENWFYNWKITGSLENIELVFSGNGTNLIDTYKIEENHWGKILEIGFSSAELDSGNYTLRINHMQGNNISYSVSITDTPPNYKILLDHRNTVNGFAHTWGYYSNFETHLRDLGVQVDQIHTGDIGLDNYDSVIVTEFGKKVTVDQEFIKDFNSTLFQEYIDYTETGGNLQIMADYPAQFNSVGYSDALLQLGGEISDFRIPKGEQPVTYTNNFTHPELFNGVVSIGASGSAINPVNSSQTSIGTYYSIATGIGEVSRYLSIGINTTLGAGTVYIWSGSANIQNENFRTLLDNYDQFLLNYLAYYV